MGCSLIQFSRFKLKFIILLFLFNSSIAQAEKLDLGPFKGKLSGTLTFTIDNSYIDYEFIIINLSDGNIVNIKKFKSKLGQSILLEPEISPKKKHVLFSGYIVNDEIPKSQIFKLDLKTKELTVWSKSKINFTLPRYSKNGVYLVFSDFYNSKHSKLITYSFKSDKYKELPCLPPEQCVTPNWNYSTDEIVYINDKSQSLKSIKLNLNKIKELYKAKNNFFLSYPSYTKNENIIFTHSFMPDDIVKNSSIMLFDKASNKTKEIYNRNEYILSAITLNEDRYIAFVTKEYINQSRLTIYDRKTEEKIIYTKALRNISPPVWRP